MIRGVAFQTKARTVDHLGREQIADCPTAISELWKNAFDAYARRVNLDIFAGDDPVAVVSDDGHGMNRDEFEGRWLVVGTESKATSQLTPRSDRGGLYLRPRQGQKGIGRLSCANLGPVLLFISKRENSDYVVALVDWRLFENPFLNLADIYIPVTEVVERRSIFAQLPALIESLADNIQGDIGTDRGRRLINAWNAYDALYEEESANNISSKLEPPSVTILSDIKRLPFNSDHLINWPVWSGDSLKGTALLVSNINYDLRAQLDDRGGDSSAKSSRDRMFETLSSFVDPFVDKAGGEVNARDPQFSYGVQVWDGGKARLITGKDKQFDRHMVEPMEHIIQGTVAKDGKFHGRIKAFGEWLPDMVVIEPPKDLILSNRADIEVGAFDLFIAAMEFAPLNTTHTASEFRHFKDLAERYAGFMMFRDGLRVMPYGRTDNDFFEIEYRRSKSAGREFWNHRQMFGRIAIGRDANPNLKDKAGREGLIDNRAAKALKGIVSNLLMQSARRYFGSASEIRNDLLPTIREDNEKERAEEARSKLRKKQRQAFRSQLQNLSKSLPDLIADAKSLTALHIDDERSIPNVQSHIEQVRVRLSEYRLPGAPKTLGSLENTYMNFKSGVRNAQTMIVEAEERIGREIEAIAPTQPADLLRRQIVRNSGHILQRLQTWRKDIETLQSAEFARVIELIKARREVFQAEAEPLILHVERGELSLSDASATLLHLRDRITLENEEIFNPYIGALQSLQESIDLEHAATFGMEELSDLRSEVERLNSLAQLGIAVEIVGHELQSFDDIIASGLRELPPEIRSSKAGSDIEFGYEGLTDQLRFLSPLRLAGQKTQRWISGEDIYIYLESFFKIPLARNHITLTMSAAFDQFRVFEQQSRIYPVFINLINNSIYWLSGSANRPREIKLCVVAGEVFVSDSGPGVDAADLGSLFSLFFTKKARGGRGVGLYLSRANLAAGGHRIRYEADPAVAPMTGANFGIKFRGAEFDAE